MAQPGDTVLVHGATGGVGLAAVQLAVAAGMTVIGTGGSPAGRELAQAQGDHGPRNNGDRHEFVQHAPSDHAADSMLSPGGAQKR